MTEHYSTDGAICPFCGHLERASDSDGMLYDEGRCEWECGECGEEFRVSAYVQWSWTTTRQEEPPHDALHDTPVNRERQRGERRDAMTPAELTARGVRVKYIYAPDCDECGDTGWVYFSCGTPWRCKCQRKSRAALTTGENDD